MVKNDSLSHVFNTKPSHELKDYTLAPMRIPDMGTIEIKYK